MIQCCWPSWGMDAIVYTIKFYCSALNLAIVPQCPQIYFDIISPDKNGAPMFTEKWEPCANDCLNYTCVILCGAITGTPYKFAQLRILVYRYQPKESFWYVTIIGVEKMTFYIWSHQFLNKFDYFSDSFTSQGNQFLFIIFIHINVLVLREFTPLF